VALAGLPGLLAGLAVGWSVIVGARLDGGHAAYVAEAVALDGTPVVIKAAIPGDRRVHPLRAGTGRPAAGGR
jgi:hypothetical protein